VDADCAFVEDASRWREQGDIVRGLMLIEVIDILGCALNSPLTPKLCTTVQVPPSKADYISSYRPHSTKKIT
jgi:hypothetical protein